LQELIEGRMEHKAFRERKRLHSDLESSAKCLEVKSTAED